MEEAVERQSDAERYVDRHPMAAAGKAGPPSDYSCCKTAAFDPFPACFDSLTPNNAYLYPYLGHCYCVSFGQHEWIVFRIGSAEKGLLGNFDRVENNPVTHRMASSSRRSRHKDSQLSMMLAQPYKQLQNTKKIKTESGIHGWVSLTHHASTDTDHIARLHGSTSR
ncbi:hypothetical protein E4T56_gene10467 [Termitomyces sp. T112]|nr:hypothetical protein E4T56_gene10467 [Termitomyces sp. T112]